MTNDTQKIIDGLQATAAWIKDDIKVNGIDGLKVVCAHLDHIEAALALLKAQEPRVMTVSEIGALSNGDVVWVEFTDGRLLPMMVEDGCLMRWRFLWRICEDAFLDDDYKARAWTSRPTDEQREAVKWE